MSLSRIERMSKLVQLAQKELDEASQVFKSLQQQSISQQAQLEQLKTFLNEYIERQTSGEGSTLQQLKTTNAFMDKLNKAIGQQKEQLDQTNIAVEEARAFWIEKRSREQALVRLTEKMKSDRLKKLDKLEQKLMDELSGRTFRLDTSNED